jgi:PAS domain S-box-containing protein
MNPLTLVIIEDEEAHFSLMKRTIARHLPEATVHHFQEPAAALERMEELHPDIVITDYLMPGMNGIEVLETLNRANQDIPVIMITGQGDENIAVQAMKLGAWDYLVKSSDFFTLLPSVIEKVLREWTLRESLSRSEERFKDLAERTSDWIWEVDPEGRFVYSSPVSENILGYPPEEITGKYFYEFFRRRDGKAVRDQFFGAFSARRPIVSFEHCLHDRDGNEVIVETHGVPFFSKSGDLLGYRGVHRDITTRKRAEQALRESEEKFRSIFEESPIGIELYDSEGRLIDANKACLDIFGVKDLKEILDLKISDNPNIPEDAKAKLRIGETVKYETTYDFDQVRETQFYRTTESGNIHLDVVITQLGFKEREAFAGYLFQVRDISKRKRAEEHIRILTQQLMKAEEIERQKISCDLHDHLAQDLSTLKIDLDTLFDNYPDVPDEKRQRLQEISKMVQGTIMSVRNLAYNLSPASLTQLGLVPIIRQFCEEYAQRNNVRIDLFPAGMDGTRLDFDTEIGLFRVIQEALNNVKNHADATRVVIRLVASYPKIILRIEDDGRGFDVQSRIEEAYGERRMGIRSMQERIAHLNGEIRIDSRPSQGTKIIAEVPYKEK